MLSARKLFPILKNIPSLVYLDSTATTLKPQTVLDIQDSYYTHFSANVFRGIYAISEKATEEYENSRAKIANFIGSSDPVTVLFTRNTTESLNVLAYTIAGRGLKAKSSFVVTIAEHHANFVPWQQLVAAQGGAFVVTGIDENGVSELSDPAIIDKVITKDTVAVGITLISNVLGTINDIRTITKRIKEKNKKTLVIVDAAQAMTCHRISVDEWGIDALAFSGHKMFGPTGIGVLWAKRDLLEALPPFLYGGEMIESVSIEKTVFAPLPNKYEAGTPHIAGAIGLGAAVEFIESITVEQIHAHVHAITEYALARLQQNPYIQILGPTDPSKRIGLVAFTHKCIHPHDLSSILAEKNICIRAGHHCAMPLHKALGVQSSARASFSIYTSKEDIDALITTIEEAEKLLKIHGKK